MAIYDYAKKKVMNGVKPQQVTSPVSSQDDANNSVMPSAGWKNPISGKTLGMQNTGVTPLAAVPPAENPSSGYVDPYAVGNEKLRQTATDIGKNISNYKYDFNTDPAFQALKTQYQGLGDQAYSNTLGSRGEGISSYIAAAASQAKQGYNEKLMGLVPGMEQNAYNRELKQYDIANQDYKTGLEQSALDYTKYKDNLKINRDATTDANLVEDRATVKTNAEHAKFADSIAGRTDIDFSQQIKDNQNDSDASNDWMIAMLQKEKTNKMNNMEKDYSAKATQFESNYQAEINNLDKNDPIYTKKAAILKMYQEAKKARLKGDQKEIDAANEKIRQFNSTLGETIRSNKASESISQQNANTATTNAANKPMTTADKNKLFSDTYTYIKAMSYDDAIKELKEGQGDYMEAFGESGYRSLWNEVLRDAIKDGRAKPMEATPTSPKNTADISAQIVDLLNQNK